MGAVTGKASGDSKPRVRLDQLLVERGLFPSRQKAQAHVLAGEVLVGGRRVDKPGTRVPADAPVEVLGPGLPFVSRGGLKLARALDEFGLDVRGLVALDAGASTGGFTDCLLQRGAARVYAVDVGYGQLDFKLRQDPRVVVLERRNVRHLSLEDVGQPVDLVTVDLSFISLRLVLPILASLLRPGGWLLALVKPQFEAGRKEVGKGGVVRDPAVHEQVLERVLSWAGQAGLEPIGLTWSPLLGPAGNIEFLAGFHKAGGEPRQDFRPCLRHLVSEAWAHLVPERRRGG